MKAVRTSAFAADFSHVSVDEIAKPEPGPGQVRVKMRLSPVNPSDINFISGIYHQALQRMIWNQGQNDAVYFDPAHRNPCPAPPYVLGGEGVGVVDACGSGFLAKRLRGKRVAVVGGPPSGVWQEYAIVEAKKAVAIPDAISDEQGAMFFVNPLSAYVMVREVLCVPAHAYLLVTAAGSALGKSVVRMGKRYGYRTICVVRSGAHTAQLNALGADAVIETDRQDLIAEVHRLTGGRGVSYALDCVGGNTAEQVVRCLSVNGHLVVYGTLGKTPMQLNSRDLMMPVAQISGFFAGNWVAQQSPLKLLGVIRQVKKLIADGIFDSDIAEVFSPDKIHAALAAAASPGRMGKVLLKFS